MSNEYRLTTLAAEVLDQPPAPVRVSSIAAEVGHKGQLSQTVIRASTVVAEALYDGEIEVTLVKTSSMAAEILTSIYLEIYPRRAGRGPRVYDPDVQHSVSNAIATQSLPLEINPYRPTAPTEILETSTVLHAFMEEQSQTLRQQHNLTQTGGSTYPWEIITRIDATPNYTLGSLGRFYNDSLGMVHARYVRFQSMVVDPKWPACPVGFKYGTATLDWIVTNDFSKSSATAVLGVFAPVDSLTDDFYGWVTTDGTNVQSIQTPPNLALEEGDPLLWVGTNLASTTGEGIIFGRVRQAGPKYDLSPGTTKIGLEGESIAGTLDPVKASVADLSGTVQSQAGSIAAVAANVETQASAIQDVSTQIAKVDSRVDAESLARRTSDRASKIQARADKKQLARDFHAADAAIIAAYKAADAALKTYIDSRTAAAGSGGSAALIKANQALAQIVDLTTRIDALSVAVGTTRPFRIVYSYSTAPTPSVLLDSFTFDTGVTFDPGVLDSVFRCATAPAANTTITLSQAGTPVATILFTSASTFGAVTWTLETSFVPGDALDIMTPANLNGMVGFFFALVGRFG